MALDLNRIKKKLDEISNKNAPATDASMQDVRIRLSSPGTYFLRLVPNKEDPGYPFVELKLYYDFTKKGNKTTILSPISYGEKDPIYEKAMTLKSTGIKEDWLLSRTLQLKTRVFALAIVRGQEQKGPRWWGFSQTVWQDLMGYMKDPEYGDITDPYQGTDIKVECISKEQAKNSFGDTKVTPKRTSSPLSTNESQLEKWLTDQPDLYKTFKKYSYEQLEQIFEEYTNKQSGIESDSNQIQEQDTSDQSDVLNVMDKFRKQMERKK